ncbi:hypothetical protein C8T65DRAFT_741948 [Cerioporus squamosus]|nr:hypothetical protein C8T65DRAFT_741948 [Cerioporus squamosus]
MHGIHKLPPELLSLIFWHRRDQCPQYDHFAWLTVTWVCRCWRTVALSYPALWRTIYDGTFGSNKSWIPIFLERAAGVPLVVAIEFSKDPQYTVQALIPYAHTLRIFRLHTRRRSILLSSFTLIKTTFPYLETLELVCHPHEDDHDRDILPPASYDLTRQHAPLLTNLNVGGLNFPWNSTIYSSLRSLCLSCPSERIPIHRLLLILQACPSLEDLSIMVALPLFGEAALHTPIGGPVSLPSLRSLLFIEELPGVTAVCDRIIVPPSCKIGIHTYPLRPDIPLEESLSAVIPKHAVFKPLLSKARTFELVSTEEQITISAALEPRSKPNINIHLQATTANEAFITPDLWEDFLDAFPGAPLLDAVISYMFIEDFTLRMWRSFSTRFPQLETLRVGREAIFNVGGVDIFMYLLLMIGSDPAKEPSFPRYLHLLELRCLILDERTLEALVMVLEDRRDYGYSLAELTLTDAYCREDMDVDATKRTLEQQVKLSIRQVLLR